MVCGLGRFQERVSSDALSVVVANVFLQCPLSSHPKLVTLETRSTKKRLAPDFLIYLVRTTLPKGFSRAMFSCQDVTAHCALAGEVLIILCLS